jgi:sulfate transport system permease protein
MVLKTFTPTWDQFWAAVSSPRVLAPTGSRSAPPSIAALVNVVFGLVAWVLVRYTFLRQAHRRCAGGPAVRPARRWRHLADRAAGRQWLDRQCRSRWASSWRSRNGVVIALIFIGLPFVVRTVQPVLEESEKELEEAAMCLGATRMQTFTKVIFPSIAPALLTGLAMDFARAGASTAR